ncbi:glycosyltransferase family 4 protein [Leifsonia sp. NPDC056824]|uniref:glycosyltransferase family 4 protein n=1 Tax=Leifsonia sp. NPDC056824 TaxID=3345953 RepID=UPI0036C00077
MPEPHRDGPLRIAVVYDCLYPVNTGGGERVYRAIAELLVQRGHAVDYLTRSQWEAGAAPATPFRVHSIWRGEIATADGTRTTGAALGFAAAVFRALVRRRRDYDLVLVSALPPLNVLAARLALLGSRVWLAADWLEVWPLRKWREYSGLLVGGLAWAVQSLGLRASDEATVNSRFTLERAHRGGLDAPKGLVLGLLDLVPEAVAVATPAPEVEPGRVLFAGRHIPDKRLPTLPAALLVVAREHPGVRLVVTGSGSETGALLAAAAEAGVEVDLRGRVTDTELETLMATAAVLVNPSRREGFGLVVAEAAAHGTPSVVVAGEDNAAAELVADGVNGYVAASTAPEELGAAIGRALDDGEALRTSTLVWFRDARASSRLDASVDALLARYRAARTR